MTESARQKNRSRKSALKPVFPVDAVRLRLIALRDEHGTDETALRNAGLQELKSVFAETRQTIEALLIEDGSGLNCARRLSDAQDDLIRIIYDFGTSYIYRAQNPSNAEQITIVAVGGYGRGTLAPSSDIDLLFLRPYKQTAWGESVIEFILYMLWDMGFKVGHATRTVPECVKLSKQDMTIRTSLLEARWLWGDRDLFASFEDAFVSLVIAGTGPQFIEAKLKERDTRHKRSGESRYLVEPNVKEGKGGLRDLQSLFWIGQYFYRVQRARELIKAGVFTRTEFNLFRKCGDFLWAVRCHLHFMTGRAEERLTFDLQRELATRLGYTSHPGQRDVERFMKHYFLVAKDVGDLTRILCAALELRHAKPTGMLTDLVQKFRRTNRPAKIKGSTDFQLLAGRIIPADDEVFTRDPVNLIRVFSIALRTGHLLHPDLLTLIRRSLKLIDGPLRKNPEANAVFLKILLDKKGPLVILRRMNEAGVLGRFIPEFGRIVSLVQFNMYHHYTVDEHLLLSVGALSEIERGERGDEHPLAHEIIHTIDRKVLFVAVFMHDIAKGRPEDHSIAGAKIARRLCPRLGLTPAETETVAWLIEHHLLMSTVAQSRDIMDPKTISDFANVVQSIERLKMLIILTVADIRAVGPGVWNGWKGQLLRGLYYETERVVSGGHTPGHSHAIAEAKEALRARLLHWKDADFAAYVERHTDAYWLKAEADRQYDHAQLISRSELTEERFAVDQQTDAFRGVTEITIIAPDNPALLSTIAGACSASGANIVDATAFTTTDGLAVDTVAISRIYDTDDEELDRAQRICAMIEDGVRGKIRISEKLKRRTLLARKNRLKAFSLETQVTISNDWSDRYTVIEVSGLDRTGLLHDLTSTMARLNLNIASAHIVTFGERAVDVFYVTDMTGGKIVSKPRQATIRKQMAAAFAEPQATSPAQPRKVSAAKATAAE